MKALNIRLYASALLAVVSLSIVASADDTLWNLPYLRPAKYNYLSYFSADVNTSLAADPGYFKRKLANAWVFYKTNYLLGNGLIMQMSGQGVNTTTAVSEGVGYGMLLALLNNDQTTFNKIFAGANTLMWNSSHNSYFNWKIVNGGVSGTGAATDAELDICLALIFADKLQQKSSITKWTAYNSGGVTYASRATQMLQSIKSNMTSNNFLLPGDNWGGNGLSNLNPSYFSTGAMRVFDQYQTALQFAPVATACYTVLKARNAQFGKGQAPDWCTSSGGQASQPSSGQTYQGLGMTDDAIRVPWRICLDALWFNNSDAKTFCSNSRNTLSNYTQTATNPNALLVQMGEYNNNQAVLATTAGSFHFVAMWLCGAMGSLDAAYSKQCINGNMLVRVGGQSDCFGDKAMSDQYFYYNQSIAMLGYAAITGQFPNVLSDTIKSITSIVDAPLGAAIFAKQSVTVYPGGLRFRPMAMEQQPFRVELFGLKGNLVLSQTVDARTGAQDMVMPIARDRLAPSEYLVKVSAPSAAVKEFICRIVWK